MSWRRHSQGKEAWAYNSPTQMLQAPWATAWQERVQRAGSELKPCTFKKGLSPQLDSWKPLASPGSWASSLWTTAPDKRVTAGPSVIYRIRFISRELSLSLGVPWDLYDWLPVKTLDPKSLKSSLRIMLSVCSHTRMPELCASWDLTGRGHLEACWISPGSVCSFSLLILLCVRSL